VTKYDAWLTNDPRDDGGLRERVTEEVLSDILDNGEDFFEVIADTLRPMSYEYLYEWDGAHYDALYRWTKSPTKWAWVINVWQNTPTGRAELEELVEKRMS
jgi:hypothetical protein